MIKILFFFSICFVFTSCDYYLINPHNERVGLIKKSNFKSDNGFELCFDEKIFPHYYGSNRSGFSKNKDSLDLIIHQQFDNKGHTDASGYITIRFIIDCNGVAGLYNIEQVTTDFKEATFSEELSHHLLSIVQSINDWKPIKFYGFNYDSFYHITFKIINGEIVEILS